jgi:peptidoglycan/LPS O-acetylase OafA/YrhL
LLFPSEAGEASDLYIGANPRSRHLRVRRAFCIIIMLPSPSAIEAHEACLRRRHIPNLDALRGISILWVILHHIPALHAPPWAAGAERIIRSIQENGRHGVSFFFVISGFLICTLFLREERTTGGIDLPKFYGRRMLRLMPLYYLMLGVYCVLVLGVGLYSPANRALFEQKLPSYLFYYSNLTPVATQGPFFFAWSLAVEEQFYLLFGLLMRFVSRAAVIALCAGLLALKAGIYAVYGQGALDLPALRIALSYQEPILLGVLLAFAMSSKTGYALARRFLADPRALAAMGLGIVLLTFGTPIEARSSAHAQAVYVLMTLFVGGASLLPSLSEMSASAGGAVSGARAQGALGAALDHIGKVSYGMYLVHMLVINSTRRLTEEPLVVFAIATPVTIGLATLIYRYVEAPILRFRTWLEPKAQGKGKERACAPLAPAASEAR